MQSKVQKSQNSKEPQSTPSNGIQRCQEAIFVNESLATNQGERESAPKGLNRRVLLEACGDLAHHPSILTVLDADLRKHGFAGLTNIPQLVFLAAYTRMFSQPVSVIVKGPSSSGKSFALHAGLRYVPKTAYKEIQGLSEKAIAYFAKLFDLRHRYLVIGEAAGLAEGNGRTLLRQLLTEGEIRYVTVHKTTDGHAPEELIVEGPIGLMMTTTANSLHWEDETRMLSLHVDQSPQQIRRVLDASADNGPSQPSSEDLSRWHALHDFVVSGSNSVVIPYDKALLSCFPSSHQRVLRDGPRVLALIRAHAILHQRSRECQEDKIVATLDDYSAVYKLVGEALAQGLDRTVAPHIMEVVGGVRAGFRRSTAPVSITELAGILGKDVGAVSRSVKAAVELGYLENQSPGGQGRRAMLVPGNRQLPRGTVLPSPDELMTRFEEDGRRAPQPGQADQLIKIETR